MQDTLGIFDSLVVNPNGTASFGGLLTLLGKMIAADLSGAAATTIATSGTIATSHLVSRTTANGTTATGVTLAAGTVNGQICIVTNEDATAADTITFGTTVASNFVFGATASTIAGGSMAIFIWLSSLNSGAGAWVRVKAA